MKGRIYSRFNRDKLLFQCDVSEDLTPARATAEAFLAAYKIDKTFPNADLRGADFSGMDLRDSYFFRADLSGANFDKADVSDAYFRSAALDGASFEGAKTDKADFVGTCFDKGRGR